MFQACPVSWTGTPSPLSMESPHDNGVFNSFCPTAYNSVLSQTFCEIDIDNSMHRLFDGLPEIFEDHLSDSRDVDAAAQVVTVASLLAIPSTPPPLGSRSSSYHAQELSSAARLPVMIRPKVGSDSVTDRRGGRKGRGAGARGKRVDFKMPAPAVTGKSKVLDCTPLPENRESSLVSAVAHMVPKILPGNLKGSEPVAMANPLHVRFGPQLCLRVPKPGRTGEDTVPTGNSRTQRTRYFDKVEHIVRERWRRDDMASKFLALESLLPPSAKRDRSTIVEDSMKLVKNLQHRKEQALRKRAKLQQTVACASQSPAVKLSRIIQKIGSLAVMSPLVESESAPSPGLGPNGEQSPPVEGVGVCTEAGNGSCEQVVVPKFLSECVHRLYVHSGQSIGDIAIEMICERIPNFHSRLVTAMESLRLDVLRCSVASAATNFVCNITVRPFPSPSPGATSSATVMEGLSAAFQRER